VGPRPDARPTLDDLYEAIAEALLREGLVDESLLDAAMEADDWRQSELGRLVRDLASGSSATASCARARARNPAARGPGQRARGPGRWPQPGTPGAPPSS
jgi:Ca-activated chloride channel homolog